MGQYFDQTPSVSSRLRQVDLLLPDLAMELTTDRGVFSAESIDTGSKYLLLEGPKPMPGDKNILDIGTGYGAITCALASRNPDATVWGVEINVRARQLTVQNAAHNSLQNISVHSPDEVPDGVRFDRIWSNPPIRVGKTKLHELLMLWLPRLTPEGSAHLVVQKHLGADSLHRWLQNQGYTVVRRGSRKAFRLLDITLGPDLRAALQQGRSTSTDSATNDSATNDSATSDSATSKPQHSDLQDGELQ